MSRAICISVACAWGIPAALASPHSDPTTGRAVFTGATLPSATSIELNPAALGLTEVDEIYLGGTAVVDRVVVDRQLLDIDSGALSAGPSVHDVTLSPGGMLAGIVHFKDRVTVAGALRVGPGEVFPSGEALRYHSLGGSQRTYGIVAATEVRITNEVLLGVSFAGQPTYLKLRYARDTALEAGHGARGVDSDCGGAPCGVENPAATERYDINVHSAWLSAITINIGLVVQLGHEMWIGLAYHTAPNLDVQNELDGTMDVTRAPRDGGGVLHGGATVNISHPASVDSEFRARVAPQLDLHVGFRWEDLSRLAAYDVRGYGSTFTAAGIPEWTERPRGFHDPFALWAGVEQADAGETWRFGGRLGIETSSVRDDRTSAMAIAPTSLTADLGVQLRLPGAPNVIAQLSYGFQYFPSVSVRDSAFDPRDRIDCIKSGYDYSTAGCEATRLGYAIPTADGDYSRMEHAFRLGVRFVLP
ncbi:MAG: hypothetical protein JWO36_6762 [Myxococcales bacterium]|nr:hypothetical protein [Myxococcales bacterium]